MITLRHLHRLIALGLGMAGALPGGMQAAPAENIVTVQFSIYAWKADVQSLSFGPGREVELVESLTRSKTYNYTGPALLQFTQAGPVATEPGQQPQPKPVIASTELPTGVSRITLLTAPVAKGRYQIYAIPEDGDTLPEGTIRLHNITKQKLLVVYDEKSRLELDAGQSTILRPAGDATLLRVAGFINGRWRELFNNVAVLGQDRRQNILLIPGASEQGVSMYTLPAWPRPAEPATPVTVAAASRTRKN